MGGDIEYPGIFGCWSGRFNSETWLMVALALALPHPRAGNRPGPRLCLVSQRGAMITITLPYLKQASLIRTCI